MEEVIIYTRVSTDEQAEKGYSLRAQLERLHQYCSSNNLIITRHFQEDYSAKTFERPEFNKLLAYLKQNKNVRKVLFVKWDRFSRNAEGALTMIRLLKKMNVEAQAVDQYIDPSVPEQKMMLSIYLTAPEIENDRRSMNTLQGMRRAMSEGRWVSGAPIGYRNTRDDRNKPIIVPSNVAHLVQESFELYATGRFHIEEIRRMMNAKGLKCCRNNFWRMLHNTAYLGLITIKAHMNEPERIVRGLHPPLVDEELFYRVQERLNRHKKRQWDPLITLSEDFPLHGLMDCPRCGRKLRSSKSTSYSGKRHAYYHCSNGCKFRCRPDVAEEGLFKLLRDIELSPEWKDVLIKSYKQSRVKTQSELIQERKQYQERLNVAEELLLKIDEKFLTGDIDQDDYKRMKSAKKEEIEGLKAALAIQGTTPKPFRKEFELGIEILSNFSEIYKSASLRDKKVLLRSTFSENLVFENPNYRTPQNSLLIDVICGIRAKFEGFENKKTGLKTGFSSMVARRGIEPLFQE